MVRTDQRMSSAVKVRPTAQPAVFADPGRVVVEQRHPHDRLCS
ncbi:MAG: hypothetical protein ACYCZN_06850 [Candidatus Dormibacteria bacterium]